MDVLSDVEVLFHLHFLILINITLVFFFLSLFIRSTKQLLLRE